MSTTHFDGDYSAAEQNGNIEFWRDEFTQALMYRQPMQQLAANWEPAERTLVGPEGGYLVEESTPKDLGAGVYSWDRIFSEIPSPHNEPEGFVHNYQQVAGIYLVELAVAVTSRVAYAYYYTTDFSEIEILRAYKLAVTGGVVYARGTSTDGEGVAEDSQVSRWKGNIYVRKTRYVPADVFDAL